MLTFFNPRVAYDFYTRMTLQIGNNPKLWTKYIANQWINFDAVNGVDAEYLQFSIEVGRNLLK